MIAGSASEVQQSAPRAAITQRIVVVGYQRRLLTEGNAVEWIDPDGKGAVRLPRRIRQHRIGRVILVQADITHRVTIPILEACRSVGVPLTYCDKGTRTQIKLALAHFS